MNAPQSDSKASASRANLGMVGKLLVVTVLMFGFGFALVPLYEKICEVTGINVVTKRDEGAERFARSTQVDASRKVVVEFDANSRGPWSFTPRTRSVEAHPGELVTVVYDIRSNMARDSVGQAIPSYAPMQAAAYFRKLECFCFEEQKLAGGEGIEFPVVFVIDPKLPQDVTTITLSYTFFEVTPKIGAARADGAEGQRGG